MATRIKKPRNLVERLALDGVLPRRTKLVSIFPEVVTRRFEEAVRSRMSADEAYRCLVLDIADLGKAALEVILDEWDDIKDAGGELMSNEDKLDRLSIVEIYAGLDVDHTI